MALRKIREIGDPILNKTCKEVKEVTDRTKDLIDDMFETMYEAQGVGLAAPQVGILKRVVVIDVGEGLIELVNPEIISHKGKQEGTEGCLSFPGEYGTVIRPNKVTVKAQDRNGKEFTMQGKELLARAFCHEIDHLNGIVFKDLVEEMIDING